MTEEHNRLRWQRLLLVVVPLILVTAVVWWGASFFSARAPESSPYSSSDPRILYDGPFRNIHPEVAYVGDNACVPCHKDISRSYQRHPMAHSLTPITATGETPWYDAAHHNPFTALGDTFRIEQRDHQVWHTETRTDARGQPLYRFESEVAYAIGSGTHGRSYLTNRNGYLFQTAISWYAQKRLWDLSPGFDREQLSGRPVSGECLFCHANRARFREGSLNRYARPIFEGHAVGCERCHGPGEKHVQSKQALDIVNPDPKKEILSPDLCDAVCEQCHLEGVQRVVRRQRRLYDFRPGLPLQDFWRVFVRPRKPGAKDRAVTHVEQMRVSRCFPGRPDTGRLSCISCHDPHVAVAPENRVAYYRERCLRCHENCSLPRPVRLKRQADDSCIACHMPAFPAADIAHTAATDHRIPRRPASAMEPRHPAEEDQEQTLEPFHPFRPEDEAEVQRDLGLALLKMIQEHELAPEVSSTRTEALLAGAVQRDADDVPAWEALGLTLLMRHRPGEALAALENVLHREPERETALSAAATLTWNIGRREESVAYWRRAVAVNPWLPSYERSLTQVHLQLGQRDEARTACRAWLRLEPMSVEARRVWIDLLLREGKTNEAREEFTRLKAMNPPQLDALRAWFKQRLP